MVELNIKIIGAREIMNVETYLTSHLFLNMVNGATSSTSNSQRR